MPVKDPAIDAGNIQNPVEDPAVPLYTFVVDAVHCREHVVKVTLPMWAVYSVTTAGH